MRCLGCDKVARKGKKYCSFACYNVARVRPAEERFWRHVNRSPGDGCWLWTASVTGFGYGCFTTPSVSLRGNHRPQTLAHRYSWELHFGPIPAGRYVLHHCDTPACVRPDHLFLGTYADNTRDREAKGRGFHAKGERHPQAKLSESDVLAIRATSGIGTGVLAKRYGVTTDSIRLILARRTWRHV